MRKILMVLLALSILLPSAGPAQADTVYVVQRGDTLFNIANRFGVSLSSLAAANGISNLNLIFVGEQLTIPGTGGGSGNPPPPPPTGSGTTYIVQRGDSLGLIAARFGVSLADLIAVNNIANPNLVFVGQVLVIPGTGGGSGNPPPPGPTATAPPPGLGRHHLHRAWRRYLVGYLAALWCDRGRFDVGQWAQLGPDLRGPGAGDPRHGWHG